MNQLKVNQQHSILTLYEQGWSKRRIARVLALDRATVRKYLARVAAKPATNPHPGDTLEPAAKSPTHPHTGSTARARAGQCLRTVWRDQIEQALAQGLSVKRIHQDLIEEQQFAGSYHAVRRFVVRLVGQQELPFRPMECAPGQELQVDFGRGAWVLENGQRRRPHLFRAVLSCSRKGDSEVVWRQATECFIRCLENAYPHYGGTTATVVIDYVPRNIMLSGVSATVRPHG